MYYIAITVWQLLNLPNLNFIFGSFNHAVRFSHIPDKKPGSMMVNENTKTKPFISSTDLLGTSHFSGI